MDNVPCEQSVSLSPEVVQAIKQALMEQMASWWHFHGPTLPCSISDASYPHALTMGTVTRLPPANKSHPKTTTGK